MATVRLGSAGGAGFDTDEFDVSPMRDGQRVLASSSVIRVTGTDGSLHEFSGSGFQMVGRQVTAGVVSGYTGSAHGGPLLAVSGASVAASSLFAALDAGDSAGFLNAFLGGPDAVTGSAQGDVFRAGAGDDILTGGGGLDILDGGAGVDTAAFSGARASYAITLSSGRASVQDGRAGTPDGRDLLFSVERLQFSDRTLDLTRTDSAVEAAYARMLRQDAGRGGDLALDVGNGFMTRTEAIGRLVDTADATTSVATLSYAFFTGRVPTEGGIDYLVSPTGPNPNNINSGYYQSFNLENRYINFAVNLGKLGEGAAGFTRDYGSLSLFEATQQAYETIFGGRPSEAKVRALLEPTLQLNNVVMTRAEYFAYYGKDGTDGVGAKAAMVGWLLAEAAKADLGLYARANEAFLTDVGLNNASFGVDLVGVYGRPEYDYTPG